MVSSRANEGQRRDRWRHDTLQPFGSALVAGAVREMTLTAWSQAAGPSATKDLASLDQQEAATLLRQKTAAPPASLASCLARVGLPPSGPSTA